MSHSDLILQISGAEGTCSQRSKYTHVKHLRFLKFF